MVAALIPMTNELIMDSKIRQIPIFFTHLYNNTPVGKPHRYVAEDFSIHRGVNEVKFIFIDVYHKLSWHEQLMNFTIYEDKILEQMIMRHGGR